MAERKPIALIHSMLARASAWRPFVNALDMPVSPLRIELPGHGLAPDWDTSRDFSDQALELALDEMPSEPVPLVGHSFGAVLALRLAVERPARVTSLALIEPVFFAAARGSDAFDKLTRDHAPYLKSVSNGAYATAAKRFYALWGAGEWDELSKEQQSYITDRIALVDAGSPLTTDDAPEILRPGRLEELDIPVTFVDGSASHPIMAEIISQIGDRLPDAEWVTIEGGRHMLPVTHPNLIAEAVKDRLVWE